jgi:acetyltransferase-like isoleucine patch superfamily enzyme
MGLRRVAAGIVGHLPGSALRVAALRLLFGYSIESGCRVGPGCMIDCDSLTLGRGVTLGRRMRIVGPCAVAIGERTEFGFDCTISCGDWAATSSQTTYERRAEFGADVVVGDRQFFGAVGHLTVGASTWIAGRDSQFWTHGLGVDDRSVSIGECCYVGSAVRFAPGASVSDLTVVGLGSVVIGKFECPASLVAGVPARILRTDYAPLGWEARKRYLAARSRVGGP